MGFTIRGSARREDSRRGIADLIVEAYDTDLFVDDLLGSAKTDKQGAYEIHCPAHTGTDDKPDVYLLVKTPEGRLLHSTRNQIIHDVTDDLTVDVTIAPAAAVDTDIGDEIPPTAAFKTWTLQDGRDKENSVMARVCEDLENQGSILELLRAYKEILDRSTDNNDPVYTKLDSLFHRGLTPEVLQGHFYGITLGVRCGDDAGPMTDFGNVLGMLWGATLTNECPWVGKSLELLDASELMQLTGHQAPDAQPVLLGINHFNRIHTRVLNPLAFQFLNTWMDLHPAPEHEQQAYHWEKNGAYFIAAKAPSVNPGFQRDVFQLNYRYPSLGNKAPNCWLIDEMVQISEGLYLGQLCYATRKLLRPFDPHRPAQDYHYRSFGYFVLIDRQWHAEARRLFPYLEVPPDAPGMITTGIADAFKAPKFTTFTFEDPPLPICDDTLNDQIQTEVRQFPTILHYLKACAKALQDNLSNESPYFSQMGELFNRGIAPRTMDGFYYGALVSWRSAGLFELFGINTINLIYTSVGAPFSTWTGKRFDPISNERLQEITDGHETGERPTFWGSNTQALRTLKERFVGRLMPLADIWTEKASTEEAQQHGYDVKNFFFIARQAPSISPDSRGKRIFQFNYRWPNLKTIVPDCFCIDELVQIARGLYLGRLMYATNIKAPYDPSKDPEIYRYGLFGYFLLMDKEWQRIRLSIGFDLDNV